MDPYSSDLEFFDFGTASDEEIKEIQNILKGPGSKGCVELPWETYVKENSVENIPKNEATPETEPPFSPKSSKSFGGVVGPALQFVAAQTPMSPPVAPLPPPSVEAFVTMPTSVGPYPNTPYFVSRTLPYLRAYPHMGLPLFACPLPAAGETAPYGQFMPVVPSAEKFMGPMDSEQTPKGRVAPDKQFHRRKKKHPNSEYLGALESEGVDAYHRETVLSNEGAASPSIVSSERPTSMPLVPLPVPPSSFAGALPLHGYPPSLHTLSYTQMSGPQAPSPAMYYVPVFNHPYGSYISTPPSAPMVLPVSHRPEAEVSELVENKCSKGAEESASSLCEGETHVQSSCESLEVEPSVWDEEADSSVPPVEVAKSSGSEKEEFIDCNSSSDPASKSISSSPDCIPKAAAENCCESESQNEGVKENLQDSSRCWADLFKKPCSTEVNGIDRQLPPEHGHSNTFKKDIANGKFSVPASESFH